METQRIQHFDGVFEKSTWRVYGDAPGRMWTSYQRDRSVNTASRFSRQQGTESDSLGGDWLQMVPLFVIDGSCGTGNASIAGGNLIEQYPDHVAGSAVGTTGYGIVTFTLDPAGRVSRKQDQKGDTCTFNYDLAGRLTSRDYRTAANSPTGTIADNDQFSYDKAGRMLTAYSGRYSNTVGYSYDSAGRKKTESLTIAGQTYTTETSYNARGELTKYTYPDSTVVDRSYTARGELYQLKHAGTTIDTRAYDNGGRMSSSTLNNGVVDTRAYGTDNTLSSITFTGSGASIGNLSYGWDNNHNKTSETITGTMSNYGFSIPTGGYDNEDRLVSFNRTSGLSQSWSLSAVRGRFAPDGAIHIPFICRSWSLDRTVGGERENGSGRSEAQK